MDEAISSPRRQGELSQKIKLSGSNTKLNTVWWRLKHGRTWEEAIAPTRVSLRQKIRLAGSNLNPVTVWSRLKRGRTWEEAIAPLDNLPEKIRRLGLKKLDKADLRRVWRRLRDGWTLEEAISRPPPNESLGKKLKRLGVNIRPATVWWRLERGWTWDDAISLPLHTNRQFSGLSQKIKLAGSNLNPSTVRARLRKGQSFEQALLPVDYIKLGLERISKETGIPAEILKWRWYHYGSLEKAITMGPRGSYRSLPDPNSLKSRWRASRNKISYSAVMLRIKHGWSEYDALNQPVGARRIKESISSAATARGLVPSTILWRIRHGQSVQDALTTPVRSYTRRRSRLTTGQ